MKATLTIAALLVTMAASAGTAQERFKVFGDSEARRSFFETQAEDRTREAERIAEAARKAREAEAAELAESRSSAPVAVLPRLGTYHDPRCTTGRVYQPQAQRPLRPGEGGSGGLLVRRQETTLSRPCPSTGYHPVYPSYPPGLSLVLGSDGRYYPVHRPGVSVTINFGN
ncbi:hypothetical protein [Algicella marina]|uniref:Uncharacterized protein n=1 Tax=Algicella marina TaxID=2683284 RepID=A0A6P1SXP3_9RHOB|nr:hypothetical protein [Algicella marina]QHQ34527.1 hypothetical protein GO499_04645 [Algicella marina]